ncbi:pseudouridine synthase [uncultured Muribaculum sp.]|uniref:pseudouridine synthase n=1 Tax=uncultured Muribaculum sp. TaxID=1918613 RepID=UPI0025B67CBF|nr:pseudouridine synthase [uncultured Muribaculum sp.]
MDSEEKKPKRPRIGENRIAASSDGDAQHYGKVNYDQPSDYQSSGEHTQGDYQRERNYQPRPYNNNRQQGGYGNNRYNQGGYRQGNNYNNRYNQGGYQPRQQYQSPAASEGAESTTPAEGTSMSEGYTPSNRQQGGYNNNRQQGGYNNRQQGGYNNNRQQGPNRQGGYNNRRQQGPNRQGFNAPRQGKSFTPRPKRIEYEMPIPDPNEQIRLNKFMANAGICSRREADEFIQQGLVKVNGEVVTELGTKISHSDVVEYDEKVVTLESKCYILLNKPKDCVTTSDDPNGRTTVMDLVKGACNERIYPVGRLDRNTTGVLLLTNDGDLASKLTHPKYVKKKIYHVWTDKDISEDDMQAIADGIELEDGPIHADAISYATENDRNQAGIEIHSGRNRIVRRIFESLGYHVTKLDRVYFAGLTKKNLPRGRWRYLTQEEVNFLKMGSFE